MVLQAQVAPIEDDICDRGSISIEFKTFYRKKDGLFINSDINTWTQGVSGVKPNSLCRPIIARVSEMPENYIVEEHRHPWGQLAYCSQGIMKVEVPQASFIIPPERALWIPNQTPHVVSTKFGLSFRSLYIDNSLSSCLPIKTEAIKVDSLLRELILKIALWGEVYELTDKKRRHIDFLLDQLEEAHQVPLYLNMPKDKRLKKITDIICDDPGNTMSLQVWSKSIGATPRTINRLFQKETKMGFIEWRQRLRILYSLERIEQGDKISNIALDLGYESNSAFITMFKKHMSVSPKQYFKTNSQVHKSSAAWTPENSI